jgi:hypothetical protein
MLSHVKMFCFLSSKYLDVVSFYVMVVAISSLDREHKLVWKLKTLAQEFKRKAYLHMFSDYLEGVGSMVFGSDAS